MSGITKNRFLTPIVLTLAFQASLNAAHAQMLAGEPENNEPAVTNETGWFNPLDLFRQNKNYEQRDINAHTARIEQTFLKHPHLYEHALSAYKTPSIGVIRNTEKTLRDRKQAMEDARSTVRTYSSVGVLGELGAGLPKGLETTIPVTGKLVGRVEGKAIYEFTSPTRAVYDLEKEWAEDDAKTRAQIYNNPEEFSAVAKRYSEIEYKVAAGENITAEEEALFLAFETLKEETTDFPQKPDTRENLFKTSDQEANLRARLQEAEGNPEEAARILNEYNTTIIVNNTNVTMNPEKRRELGLEEIDQKIANIDAELNRPEVTEDRKAELEATKDAYQKRAEGIRLAEHRQSIQETREAIYTANQAAMLFFPNSPEIGEAIRNFEAATQIYDSIAQMGISGVTTGGVGAVMAGLNMLGSSSGGPSPEQIMMEMLQDIIEILGEIQQTVETNGRKLDLQTDLILELKAKLEEMHRDQEIRFAEIRETMARYYTGEENRDRNYAQNAVINSLIVESDKNLEIFKAQEGYTKEEYFECLREESLGDCETTPRSLHTQTLQVFNQFYATAARILEDQDDYRFNPNRSLTDLKKEEDIEAYNAAISDRVGAMLPSLGYWINAQIEVQNLADVPKVTVSNLSKVPHPEALTEDIIPHYAEIAGYIHPNEKVDENRRQLDKLENMTNRVALASQEMRGKIPSAQAVYLGTVSNLLTQLDLNTTLPPLAQRHAVEFQRGVGPIKLRNISPMDAKWPVSKHEPLTIHGGRTIYSHTELENRWPKILFPIESDSEVLGTLESLPPSVLIALGQGWGILNIGEKYTGEVRWETFSNSSSRVSAGRKVYEIYATISVPGATRMRNNKIEPGNKEYPYVRWWVGGINPYTREPVPGTPDYSDIRKLILFDLRYRQELVVQDYQKQIKDLEAFKDVAKAKLALETFMLGGYGESYRADPALTEFREMKEQMDKIAQHAHDLRSAKTTSELVKHYTALQTELRNAEELDLRITLPDNPNFDLGFGDVDGARDALASVRTSQSILELN